MKIAFIRKRFNPYGGAENYLATLIRHLELSDYRIHILSSYWQEVPGAVFHKISTPGFNSTLSNISFNHMVCRKLDRLEPDCTISFERTTCQDIYRAGDGCHKEWLVLRASKEGILKRFTFRINPLHRTLLYYEKEIFANTPLIIANSRMVRNQILKHYNINEKKILVLYNGVDLKRFTPDNRNAWRNRIREGYSIPADVPVILFVGSGFERKGLRTLISSLVHIDKRAVLLVVGRGDTGKFRRTAGRYGVERRIIFTGPQHHTERFYAAADCFVLPTIYDPFSNATLEAMASGLPVVTTRNNGASELIKNGVEGYIISNPLDSMDLAERIDMTLSVNEVAGEKARERAEGFSIEKAAEEFINIIETNGIRRSKRGN
jgi:UDP-glucose:(heptosyl)LPS alpha-1,3-glucosyltransferase